MVLLDILTNSQLPTTSYQLVVAHFNHGIRADAEKDEKLVRQAAESYGLAFEAGYGELGPGASEEKARKARYDFLNKTKRKYHAAAIITAHHQDDLVETAIINLLRGTGRRGLTAISDNPDIIRPLLSVPKSKLVDYAKKNDLKWRDDPSNQDERFLRNFVRRRMIPKLSAAQRRSFLKELSKLAAGNRLIHQEIANLSQNIVHNRSVNRSAFTALPNEIAAEVLIYFLRQNAIRDFDKKAIERLTVVIKTAKPGSKHDVIRGVTLKLTSDTAHLQGRAL